MNVVVVVSALSNRAVLSLVIDHCWLLVSEIVIVVGGGVPAVFECC